MQWTDFDDNPVSPAVVRFLDEAMSTRVRPGRVGFRELLESAARGRSVLDIGCVEHDATHFDSEGWKHRWLKAAAKSIVGVDIVESGVNELNSRGYDIRLMDATSDADLGSRFDVVIIGDVIEHVSRPVDLLRFAGRHVVQGGRIYVSTPNPYYFQFMLRAARRGTMLANAEHVSWVTPTNSLELARRADLELVEYYPIVPQTKKFRALSWALRRILGREPEILAWSYVYVFGNRAE